MRPVGLSQLKIPVTPSGIDSRPTVCSAVSQPSALPATPLRYYIVDNIRGVSRLVDITAGGDFLGLCDQKCSYKHVSDFGELRNYGHFLIPVHALV